MLFVFSPVNDVALLTAGATGKKPSENGEKKNDSNEQDIYDEVRVCKCQGHLHANLRWSQPVHVDL